MAQSIYHPSIEGAQHGAKSLPDFLDYAKASGAAGAQPSNYMLQDGDGFKSAQEIKDTFEQRGMKLDGVSCHCPIWVHTTAWTGSPTIRPFIPADVAKQSSDKIEQWAETYMLKLMDLCAELNLKILPTFWGVVFGWEVATGYPWGFWAGGDFDLIKEGKERFVTKTAKIREHANKLGIYLAHEIHPGTGACCADDFNTLVEICDGDKCLTVNADPSHCWEGEDWETRFRKVADRVYACHVKNFVIRPGFPLRSMKGNWPDRAMQFVDIPSGDLNMVRYVEMLIDVGYPKRYCEIMGTTSAPLIVEAESAYRDLDATSANGIQYVRDNLCFPLAAGSFEDGMGA
ncbi:MAG: sugar phosphate isomerase/epimerase [Verrucomicrobiae bacterium]|nr:sugar phosphate isomerase/epimerase [Verrucomicrobiae bacterium]MCP5521762.1 sugar phosphate isomerase/epimerase [Verrucomicrobiales bacterium]MCP5527351.1 sugar phosphate isomerase/epimerase [Verrucomicrobiales bacterium]